jgi:hypothetical protein
MITNKDKMLQAVLYNERLMKFGGYTPSDVNTIYEALSSENCVINTVAQIIYRTEEGDSESELWKSVNKYLMDNVL